MNERIELNLHTKMGEGFIEPNDIVDEMKKSGYKIMAVTDRNSVQAFPTLYKTVQEYNQNHEEPLHIMYGAILDVVNTQKPCWPSSFIALDIETTGFSKEDEIIAIVAQKWENQKVVETLKRFVKPKKRLQKNIEAITHITNQLLEHENVIDVVMEEFQSFIGTYPLVTVNEPFVWRFLEAIKPLKNPVFDMLELVHDPSLKSEIFLKNKSNDVKKKEIEWNLTKIGQSFLELSKEKNQKPFQVTVLVRNQIGLKHLYELISLLHTQYKKGLPLEIVREKSEGLLIGSTAETGEIDRYLDKNRDQELKEKLLFYDYIEVVSPSRAISPTMYQKRIKRLTKVAFPMRKLLVATSNIHYFNKKEMICSKLLDREKTLLSLQSIEELKQEFSFLGQKEAYEMIIKNPKLLSRLCEEIQILPSHMCLPEIPSGDIILAREIYQKAHLLYGKKLPKPVSTRIALELYGPPILKLKHFFPAMILGRDIVFQKVPECKGKGILGSSHEAMFLIPKMLVEESLKMGYLIESRGTLGSSLVAYLLGITEVNPLPPHYRCPNCKHTIFENSMISSGYDLKNRNCPHCHILMEKDGHQIPYASLLGIEASIIPDININFADVIIEKIRKRIELLDVDETVLYPGTIKRTNHRELASLVKPSMTETERNTITEKLKNKKTGMGIHPGSLFVIPKKREVFELTPIETLSQKNITHFDYHDLIGVIPKFGLLGHTNVTMLQNIIDISHIDLLNISFDDEKVFELLKNTCPTNTETDRNNILTGIPEFDRWQGMTELKKLGIFPHNFSECVKVLGLAHGTCTFEENALALLKQGIPLCNVIAHREDILNKLLNYSVSFEEAYDMMEFIGKGKHHKNPEKWFHVKKRLQELGIEEWYISSCEKVEYLFPKAHHVSYMQNMYRLMYEKRYDPASFFQVYFAYHSSCMQKERDLSDNNEKKMI